MAFGFTDILRDLTSNPMDFCELFLSYKRQAQIG